MARLAALHALFHSIRQAFKHPGEEPSSDHHDIEAPRRRDSRSSKSSQEEEEDLGLQLFNEHNDPNQSDDDGVVLDALLIVNALILLQKSPAIRYLKDMQVWQIVCHPFCHCLNIEWQLSVDTYPATYLARELRVDKVGWEHFSA